jgi:hypothetical protein
MGLSCVYRLLASAVVALNAASCALMPIALKDDPPAAESGRPPGIAEGNAPELARKCHDALVRAAEPYGLTKALTSDVGSGASAGPIWVTTVYRRQGGLERRTALVHCRLDDRGEVAALAEPDGHASPLPLR